MPIDDAQLLLKAPLFAALSHDALMTLAQHAFEERYATGSIIFREHDPGGILYIVQSGNVSLYIYDKSGAEVNVLEVGAGQVFGELSLLDFQPRSATARAMLDTVLIGIGRDALIAVGQTQPEVMFQLLSVVASRLRTASARLQERILPNTNETIASSRRLVDRFSDFFIGVSGNLYFVIFSAVWFVLWIVYNAGIIPSVQPFDPFPFGLLTMIVSLEMVFLSLFILIKQSRQAANDKVRNDIEYEINVRAELGIQALSQQVDLLEQRIVQRLEQIESRHDAVELLPPR